MRIINPLNKDPTIESESGDFYFDMEISQNFPKYLRILTLTSYVIGVTGILMILEP